VSAVDHANAAAEAVRILNHATRALCPSPDGYTWPSAVDAVIGELQSLAERLPQAIRQAERWLNAELDAGRVGDDRRGARPAATVEAASAALSAAIVQAGRLAAALGEAREHTSHLTGVEAGRGR
jgi:hypothetical protein